MKRNTVKCHTTRMIAWGCLVTMLVSTVALTGCSVKEKKISIDQIEASAEEQTEEQNEETKTVMDEVQSSMPDTGNRKFLIEANTEIPEYVPAVADYSVNADFSNVENADRFFLQDHIMQKLAENKFVIINTDYNEFFDLYEQNRYGQIPNFITVDSMMHTYHLYFAMLQKNTERSYLTSALRNMSTIMQEASMEQFEMLKGSEWEEAAKTNVAFFTVGKSLSGQETTIPDYVKNIVEEELKMVNEAGGIAVSPLNGENEDYSQYKPRGYYDGDENLEKYFRTMMWYGRRNFVQKDENMDRCALLMTIALEDEAFAEWEKIYTITSFFAGASDDSGVYEYLPLIREAYGTDLKTQDLIGNESAFQVYHDLTAKQAPPKINSVVFDDDGAETDKTEESKGYRFMGQRFSIDAAIFTQLCYSKVKENTQGVKRMLPDSLDVPAALGSDAALKILEDNGNYAFQGYEENMMKMREEISGSSDLLWNASLYGKWMDTLRPLLKEKGAGYPSFMQSEEWTKKDMETFLSSFTELKHDTILYSKQFMAEMGGGDEVILDDRGYVEPEVEVYLKLSDLTRSTSTGLDSFGVLSQNDKENLKRLSDLSDQLGTISIKELTGEKITEEEYELIRSYGGNIEHFWAEAVKEDKEKESDSYGEGNEFPAALVVDVATDPNGRVLEQAVGGISTIYVVVPVEGKLRIAEGGVYSYYQFEQPISERLTDSEWRRKIGIELNDNFEFEKDESIQQPDWTQSYRSKWEY